MSIISPLGVLGLPSLMRIINRTWMRPIVLAHGCFDLLHPGHIRHLEKAAKKGTLIVSVTADRYVAKGTGRPIFTESERALMLAALRCVVVVVVNHAKTAVPVIKRLRPDWYAKGIDRVGKFDHALLMEREAVERFDGKMLFTKTAKMSSTKIIARIRRTK